MNLRLSKESMMNTYWVILNVLNTATPNIALFFESGTKFSPGGHIVFAYKET